MEIIEGLPPNYAAILKRFPSILGQPVVFAFGDKLYNPGGFPIAPELMKHEQTHQKQQGDDPAGWWNRYLSEDHFRMNQEIEAYRNQLRAFAASHKDGNAQMRYLIKLAQDLASPMYGGKVTVDEAMTLIR